MTFSGKRDRAILATLFNSEPSAAGDFVASKNLFNAIKNLPPVDSWRKKRFERYFKSSQGRGLSWGAFKSFAEAKQAMPASAAIGYDNDGCTALYSDRHDRIFSYDYPVLYWLQPLIKADIRVFDIGGHLGLHYYAYRKYLRGLQQARWTVCEVPTVAVHGRELAAARGVTQLSFTSDYAEIDGQDIVLSAGALQYVEQTTITELLGSVTRRPRHVILNKIPLFDGPDFVTIEHTGPFYSPYRNFNRAGFFGAFAKLGYELMDQWEVPGRTHQLAFHPELSYEYSSGVYFAMRS